MKKFIDNEQTLVQKRKIKKLKQIYLGYKHMIQLCVVIFVLSLLTICLMVKVQLILLVYFHYMILKRTIKLLKEYSRMNNLKLTDINNYRLNEISKIKDYFNNEINERKDIIKKLNKYIVSFDYFDKIFIALSASFGTLSIASHATVIGIPAGIAGSSLTLIFTISTGVNKSLLRVTKKKKKVTQ